MLGLNSVILKVLSFQGFHCQRTKPRWTGAPTTWLWSTQQHFGVRLVLCTDALLRWPVECLWLMKYFSFIYSSSSWTGVSNIWRRRTRSEQSERWSCTRSRLLSGSSTPGCGCDVRAGLCFCHQRDKRTHYSLFYVSNISYPLHSIPEFFRPLCVQGLLPTGPLFWFCVFNKCTVLFFYSYFILLHVFSCFVFITNIARLVVNIGSHHSEVQKQLIRRWSIGKISQLCCSLKM